MFCGPALAGELLLHLTATAGASDLHWLAAAGGKPSSTTTVCIALQQLGLPSTQPRDGLQFVKTDSTVKPDSQLLPAPLFHASHLRRHTILARSGDCVLISTVFTIAS